MNTQHITELFSLDGRAFIIESYRTLLRREPDEQGMAYYLGRLAQGYGKAAVIAQLAQSPECRPLDEIKGLKKLVAEERRAQHWFFGFFERRKRTQIVLNINTNIVDNINNNSKLMNELIQSNQQVVHKLIDMSRNFYWNESLIKNDQINNSMKKISAETIIALYNGLLNRNPESDSVISSYITNNNLVDSIKGIISSEEFRAIHFLKEDESKNESIVSDIFTRVNSVRDKTKNNIIFVEG